VTVLQSKPSVQQASLLVVGEAVGARAPTSDAQLLKTQTTKMAFTRLIVTHQNIVLGEIIVWN
jgi:hypothetical protein